MTLSLNGMGKGLWGEILQALRYWLGMGREGGRACWRRPWFQGRLVIRSVGLS
ncbi:Uncharacterized protein ChrSV_1845 [Chromobacterium vaccinii]|nr:Uncharacterized protein ChrSW_1845 [Chromobacterium vaccinii]QND89303.1 Uncharacterized protein ChrSV_1845 [Chromobacterium vaccinii]SUX55683.1 Uncharacterised protein [Chromobacterium vaccinii]